MSGPSTVDRDVFKRAPVLTSEQTLLQGRVANNLNVVLTAERNNFHLNSTEDEVVAKLVGGDLHSALESFLELVYSEVRHSNVLDLASFLESFESFEGACS